MLGVYGSSRHVLISCACLSRVGTYEFNVESKHEAILNFVMLHRVTFKLKIRFLCYEIYLD
jgi:hypothetical protein